MLETVLVANPEMLMRGLTLVGRPVPVETGFVDPLGIDEDGRLAFFEGRDREDRRLRRMLRKPEGRIHQTRKVGSG